MIGLYISIINLFTEILRRKPLQKKLTVQSEIGTILEGIRDTHKFDRVYLIQFHNGNKFYTGESVQKMTTSYQVVCKGISTYKLDAALTSLWYNPIKDMLGDGFNVQNILNYRCTATVSKLTAHGVKSCAWVPIYQKNNLVGILGVEHVKAQRTIDINPLKNLNILL